MTANGRNTLTSVTRGGQIFNNFVIMLFQVVKQGARWILSFGLVCFVALSLLITSTEERHYGIYWYVSKFEVTRLKNADAFLNLDLTDGSSRRVTWGSIYANSLMRKYGENLGSKVTLSMYLSLIPMIFLAIVFTVWMRRKGEHIAKDKHIRGTTMGTVGDINRRVKQLEKSSYSLALYRLGNLKIPPSQECSGIALSGSMGVGKSTLYRDLLSQARRLKHKAIVYDISGEFTRKFYRPGIDVILNPFDKRSAYWDVWSEGKSEILYNRIAAAAIKQEPGADPFWTKAPQLVLSSLIDKVAKSASAPVMQDLMHIILHLPDEYLANIVAGTDAASVLNMNVEKLAGSIRAILSTNLVSFKYVHPTGPRFSFKEWVNDDSDRMVFINVRDDISTTLSPLISIYIEMALSAILSGPTLESRGNQNFRIITSVDELGTLNPIPSLLNFLTTARKFGGFPIFGFQSPSQCEERYGKEQFNAFSDSIGTLVAYRTNGSTGANWIAEQLGKEEKQQTTENTSYGASAIRDAVNVQAMKKQDAVIIGSQIQQLQDLECIIRLGRGMPLVQMKLEHVSYPDVALAIEESIDLEDSKPSNPGLMYDSDSGDIDGLINHMIKAARSDKELTTPDVKAADLVADTKELPPEISNNKTFDFGKI